MLERSCVGYRGVYGLHLSWLSIGGMIAILLLHLLHLRGWWLGQWTLLNLHLLDSGVRLLLLLRFWLDIIWLRRSILECLAYCLVLHVVLGLLKQELHVELLILTQLLRLQANAAEHDPSLMALQGILLLHLRLLDHATVCLRGWSKWDRHLELVGLIESNLLTLLLFDAILG